MGNKSIERRVPYINQVRLLKIMASVSNLMIFVSILFLILILAC